MTKRTINGKPFHVIIGELSAPFPPEAYKKNDYDKFVYLDGNAADSRMLQVLGLNFELIVKPITLGNIQPRSFKVKGEQKTYYDIAVEVTYIIYDDNGQKVTSVSGISASTDIMSTSAKTSLSTAYKGALTNAKKIALKHLGLGLNLYSDNNFAQFVTSEYNNYILSQVRKKYSMTNEQIAERLSASVSALGHPNLRPALEELLGNLPTMETD